MQCNLPRVFLHTKLHPWACAGSFCPQRLEARVHGTCPALRALKLVRFGKNVGFTMVWWVWDSLFTHYSLTITHCHSLFTHPHSPPPPGTTKTAFSQTIGRLQKAAFPAFPHFRGRGVHSRCIPCIPMGFWPFWGLVGTHRVSRTIFPRLWGISNKAAFHAFRALHWEGCALRLHYVHFLGFLSLLGTGGALGCFGVLPIPSPI